MTPEQQKQWMAQWRSAGPALAKVRKQELQALTDEEASRATDALLAMSATVAAELEKPTSGLVEQQRLFMKARKR